MAVLPGHFGIVSINVRHTVQAYILSISIDLLHLHEFEPVDLSCNGRLKAGESERLDA